MTTPSPDKQPAAETPQITLEQAMAELQEIAYEGAIIECRFDVTPLRINGHITISVWERNGPTDSCWRDFGGATLSEAMLKVRAWAIREGK